MKKTHTRRLLAVASIAALALASGCGTSSGDGDTSGGSTPGAQGFTPPDVPMQDSIGDMEGQVNILAWPGYAEDGSTDKSVDWVTPFEKQTGCQANVKYFDTSDEAVQLMKTGEYDVVSASGDATLRLIAAGDVAPVNTDLLKNYGDIEDFLKGQPFNSVDGQMYGVPHGWGANLLMYNKADVTPAPDQLERRLRRRVDVRRQGHGLRLADLHRRRGALPDEHPARPGDQGPVRARPGPARGGGRPAEGAEGERVGVLVGLPQGGRRPSRAATR